MGTDGYSDLEIGYVSMTTEKVAASANKSLETAMSEDVNINEKILKL